MLLVPGVCSNLHSAMTTFILNTMENRGDAIAVLDAVSHGNTPATAATQGDSFDSSYGAMYYPWVLTNDTSTNQLVWVPLEYQGFEYTAGMEGIIGTPRGVSTILMGEMSGDGQSSNRTMVVLDMLAKGATDQIISAGSNVAGGAQGNI